MPAAFRPARDVERRPTIERGEFHKDYLSGTGRPLILTDVVPHWPAFGKWSLEFFRDHYGDDLVKTADAISSPIFEMRTTLENYLTYAQSPGWSLLGRLARRQGIRDRALYMYEYKPFRRHPELLRDLGTLEFCDDWFRALRPPLREWADERLGWILIGPAGTLSRLHFDELNFHVWLGQVCGRKRCVLFSPEDSPFLYGGAVDPWAPDLDRFPLYAQATPFETILEPGELLFMPKNWWHQVRSLEFSITPSFHLVNETNFHEHLTDLLNYSGSWAENLPFLRSLAGRGVDAVKSGLESPVP